MIGTIDPYYINSEALELGHGLHPDYWEKIYGTEALKLFTKFYWAPGSSFSIVPFFYPLGVGKESLVHEGALRAVFETANSNEFETENQRILSQ